MNEDTIQILNNKIRQINKHMSLVKCNSLAEFYIKKDDRKIYLCSPHSEDLEKVEVPLDSFHGCEALIEKI